MNQSDSQSASSADGAGAFIPFEILSKLTPLAEQLGISLPGSRAAPEINLGVQIRALALDLGRLLSRRDIFLRQSGAIVTVDPKSGQERTMTARRLPDWAEQYCAFVTPSGSRRLRSSLSVDDAAQILETDTFRACLRPLAGIHQVRLPVCREWTMIEGRKVPIRIEFLPRGYDERSHIYTTELLEYPMDWTIDRAREFFLDVYGEMPFVRRQEESAGESLVTNRNWAVHVAAMVGTYCAALFPIGTLRPMVAIVANKPGTGKTRLAEAELAHVFGFVAATGAPKDEEKMEVKLEAVAQSSQPWVIFDDIGGGSLRSNALNRFQTETLHSGRPYHSNSTFFKVPNVTQIFATMNELPAGMSEDLDRRALLIELFLAEEVRGRIFKRVITPAWLAAETTRADHLAACCAFVRNWMQSEPYGALPLHPSPLETFEDFTAVIGGIVLAADVFDPLSPPERVVGGATLEEEIRRLLIKIASALPRDGGNRVFELTREDVMAAARSNGLLDELVGGGDENADQKQSLSKRFGRRMQRWRGQILTDDHGRRFVFSHSRNKHGAIYPIKFLKPAAAETWPLLDKATLQP